MLTFITIIFITSTFKKIAHEELKRNKTLVFWKSSQ